MSVAQMLAVMPSSEVTEWMAYDRLEPVGPVREDFRIGLLTSMLIAVNSMKGADIPSPLSWFPWFRDDLGTAPQREQTPEEVSAGIMRLINAQARAVEKFKERKRG